MRQRWIEFALGVFVAFAVALMLLLVVTMGSRLLRDDYKVTAYFQNVAGMRAGVGVRLAGYAIGDVATIQFLSAEESRKVGREGVWVRVVLSIDKRYAIAEDAELLLNPQLVLGEVYLDVTTGTPGKYLPMDGTAVIETTKVSKTQVERAVEEAVEKFNALAGQLDGFFAGTKKLLAFLGREDFHEDIRAVVGHVRQVAGQLTETMDDIDLLLEETRGLVHAGQGTLDDFGRATGTVEKNIAQGVDVLKGASTDLRKASAEFTKLLASLNEAVEKREGTFGLLVKSPKLHDEACETLTVTRDAFARVQAAATSVQRAADSIDTAAALLKRQPSALVWGARDKPEAVSAGGQTIGAHDIGID